MENEEIKSIVTFNSKQDSVFDIESKRYFNYSIMNDIAYDEAQILKEGYNSKKFYLNFISFDEGYKGIQIKSIDKNNPDREIKNEKINSCIWYDDENFFYGISGVGLYKYNCVTGEKMVLLNENRTYEIKKIEDGYLFFDNVKVKV